MTITFIRDESFRSNCDHFRNTIRESRMKPRETMKDDLSESRNPPMFTIWLAKVQSIAPGAILHYVFLSKNANHARAPAHIYVATKLPGIRGGGCGMEMTFKYGSEEYDKNIHATTDPFIYHVVIGWYSYIEELNFVSILSRLHAFVFQTTSHAIPTPELHI